jgi:hypothetical protein
VNWNLGSISFWVLSPSCDLLIRELEFWKSGDSGFRFSKSGVWESRTLIWPFWGLKSAHDCLNFKAKGSENKLIRISLRNARSPIVVVCRILRSNCSSFKSTECCWSYAASPSLGVRYERFDKALEWSYWEPWQYMIIKLKRDNDIFQRAWH